jgi:hypothetical protein
MTEQPQPGTASVDPTTVNLSSESVAGEEDPGAALDLPTLPSSSSLPSRPGAAQSAPFTSDAMNPGDEAPAGAPGTGENVCRACGGSGRVAEKTCPSCNGSGKVTMGVGGA